MQHKNKSPRRIVVEVHRPDTKSPKRPVARSRRNANVVDESPVQTNTVCRTAPVTDEVACSNDRCNGESEDQNEPRRTVPTIKLTPTKADRVAR